MDGYNHGNFTLNTGSLSMQDCLSYQPTESLSMQDRSLSLHPSLSMQPPPTPPPMWDAGMLGAMGGTTNNYRLERDIMQIHSDPLDGFSFQSSPPPPWSSSSSSSSWSWPSSLVDGMIAGSGGNLSVMMDYFKLGRETLQYLSMNLRGDWKKLGRYLNVGDPTLDKLEKDLSTKEAANQMLRHWDQFNGISATSKNLAVALIGAERADLAEYVREKGGNKY